MCTGRQADAAAPPSPPPAKQPPAASTAATQTAAAQAPQSNTAAAAVVPPGKCHFFLERKQRYCKFDAVPGGTYCGNHLFEGMGVGPKRVPCPWDPKGGHTVLESELEAHKWKCPGYLQALAHREQPFYVQDINAGPGAELEWPAGLQPLPEAASDAGVDSNRTKKQQRRSRPAQGPALMQAAYAAAMGEQRFMQLLQRIEAACQKVCEVEPLSLSLPPETERFLVPESATSNRPFSLKHAQQQASIVGNMKQQGLLAGAAGLTYVEYGAGKGYLSHMLNLCCPEVRKLVMMDMRSFKEKADRSMRDLDMQRLRCDIKDFDVSKVPGLTDGQPWVALGKHLCGAATDFTLRSCARERRQRGGMGGVRGLAVATCCHHRCSWRHYVARDVMTELGFSPEEFEVIAWMTGWALCGHDTPAGFGDGDRDEADEKGMQDDKQQRETAEERLGSGRAAGAQTAHRRGREEESAPTPFPMLDALGAAVAEGTPIAEEAAQAAATAAAEDWRPNTALPREQKIVVGQRCKRLIDAARLQWLRRQGFEASLVKYVPSEVSGENRLLLARVTTAAEG